jgi:RNA polymerase sigma-70 factor (ECF subfamily)
MTDDEVLWRAARGGDPAAFEAVYERHRDRVFGQASRLLRSRVEAEDVTALVFLEAWRRRDAVRSVDGSVLPWLLVTTNHVVQNATRTARRHRRALDRIAGLAPTEAGVDSGFERVDDAGSVAAVRRAFAALRVDERDVLTLCVVHEFPMAAAAATLGVPVGTVKSRLSRAKRRLAALVDPAEVDLVTKEETR